jgi:hypothetical protein
VPFDVFISYSSPDKPTADAACAALESANIRCWIAPRDISPGRDYGESIIDAIENARVFVLILSSSANASPQIKREVERAVSKGVPIIPMRIEDVMPNRTLEYFISSPHWLDAFPPPRERYFVKLIASVRALLDTEKSATLQNATSALPAPIEKKQTGRRRLGLMIAIATAAFVLAVAGGYALYLAETQVLVHTLTGHGADADSIAFTPDGKRIAAGGWDTSIVIWNTTGGAPILTIRNFAGHAAPFSPDGKWIAGGSGDSDVAIWDPITGRPIHTFSQHTKKVQSVAFSSDGRRLVSGGEDAMVYVWTIAGEQPPHPFAGHTDKVFSVDFAPDGKRIVSAGFDGNIMVWDIASGQTVYPPLTSQHSKVVAAVFSPDGGSIATAGWDFNVHVWDADTGQHLRAYPCDSIVDSVAYSPNGKLIAAGYNNGSVRIWDAQTVSLVTSLTGHAGAVWGVGFSPDGSIIGSASADKSVKTWKVP